MEAFLQKHESKIKGVLSCFDRLIFKGWLPLASAPFMEGFLSRQGILFKDFKRHATRCAERIKDHALMVAARHRRPYEYLRRQTSKEALAREIAKRDGIESGLICIFGCLETCRTFRLKYGKGRPRLAVDHRKCLCLYYYLIDGEFGFMHIRIQTWFPFTVQVYINGHEWLARKMDRRANGTEKGSRYGDP